ncbi:MAG: prolyl oligopeptidase family serine peptidase [Ignavibacteriales bacterium]|nr:prolyl oligopeptidase family serine peptidase [Ignavibacteriales bacterium]
MITERYEIVLPEQQEKMILSGWGHDALHGTVVEKIIYMNGRLKIPGYIAYPKDSSRKYPGILWNRGGFAAKGFIDEFNAKGIFGEIASWGYCVFASMYRGTVTGEGTDEMGGGDIDDVLALKELAGEFALVDNDNWGIEGWSRGGYMALLTLMQCKEIKAAVLTAALSDTRKYFYDNKNRHKVWAGLGDDFINAVIARSPLQQIDRLPANTHYLIIHGAQDETVPPEHSLKLTEKLIERGIFPRTVIFEDGDHFLKKQRTETRELRRQWFDKYLKDM